ncbi:OsmC family protein [Sphingosinicella sp. CPCC 101087]|uniref:OsmC family protein n=1 Tax=Sphingosinicella sp. CPCC 101087 TaxID=2497754 RepID=UPI001FB17092|nr:OsmC family protein [Sphingosinicella sp. CPCC 101087]
MTETLTRMTLNGIDLQALEETVEAIRRDPAAGLVEFRVKTQWTGRTRSESRIESCRIGGKEIARRFKIVADEPSQLLGNNSAPNPQELLLSALNACMTVGYVAQAAVRGVALDDIRIETAGELDLRGFLGLVDDVPPGYRRIEFVVHLEGDGTADQYREIHDAVIASSPSFFNMTHAIELNGRLA